MTTEPDTSADATTETAYRSERYNPQEIEPKWQRAWADAGHFDTDLTSGKEPFYYLTMYTRTRRETCTSGTGTPLRCPTLTPDISGCTA